MADTPQKKESVLPAIIGWGGLAVFTLFFAWIVIAQLQETEEWQNRGPEAVTLVKTFKPDGADTLDDLIKGYSLKAKAKDVYVGEFTWDAKQKEGPEYEVTLLYTEGANHRVALWRVDLDQQSIRPQGDDAANLPQRARDGIVD
ncbi:MAG: hypothetical protein ACRERC_10500 [Candidatus Binatia bacterium]